MTSHSDEHADLSHEEEKFVELLTVNFAPASLTPTQRVAFSEGLDARLRRRRWRRMFVPVFATVGVAVVVAWLALPGAFRSVPPRAEAPGAVVAETGITSPWEYELLYPTELTDADDQPDPEVLPDEYLAIARVFLNR